MIQQIEEFLTGRGYANSAVQIMLLYFALHLPGYITDFLHDQTGILVFTETMFISLAIILPCVLYYCYFIKYIPRFFPYIEDREELKYAVFGYLVYWFLTFIGAVIFLQIINLLRDTGLFPFSSEPPEHHILNNTYLISEFINGLFIFVILTILSIKAYRCWTNRFEKFKHVDQEKLKAKVSPAAMKMYKKE